jgi:ABC-type branched-subunit amino acid transport system substrate-binding protein
MANLIHRNRLLALCFIGFVIAGCNKTENTQSNNSEPSIKVLFIGQITDTANTTSTPESAAGVSAAVASINAAGGILDTPIELIICDEKADPNEAAKCARKAARENVVATLGNTSNHGGVILSSLENAGIASIGHLPISPLDFSSSVAFPLQGGSPSQVTGAARLLAAQGARRIRIATVDSLAGSLSLNFAQAALAGSEAKVVGATLIPIGAPDYASYASTLIGDSDGIVISTNADQAARIIVALRQSGVTQPISAPATALLPKTLKQLGDAAEGIYIAANFQPASAKGATYQQYIADMQQYAADAKHTVFSIQSWLAAYVLKAAILSDARYQTHSDITALSVLETMNNLNALDIGDMTPKLTTNISLDKPYNRLFIDQVLYGKIENGTVVVVDDNWHSTVNR